MLFDELLFGDRELVAQQEILEGVAVKDIADMQRPAVDLEIEPEIARAQPKKSF